VTPAPPVDRLRIFISSTITECAEERAAVKAAVASINFEPILFEDVGARPYPPREVYKPRLEASHIFVAIYRQKYGWVAPQMDISGIEDEFDIATGARKDCLVYIFTPDPSVSRDPRLQELIEKAQARVTTAPYESIEELARKVRDDVTAVVSKHFADQTLASLEAPTAHDVLQSILPAEGLRLRRPCVEAEILEATKQHRRIIIVGPLGAGKTIILAQLAHDHNWVFVDARGLDVLDVLARAANLVRAELGRHTITLVTEDAARRELSSACELIGEPIVLAIDGAAHPKVFLDLGLPRQTCLILTTREPLISSARRIDLPRLTREEIESVVTAQRGSRPADDELSRLERESGGSPLYLRFYSIRAPRDEEQTLKDLETRAFLSLSPEARELTSYLAISGRPMAIADVKQLLAPQGSAQSFLDIVTASATLVRDTSGQLDLVHEHPRQTILELLRGMPTNLSFFSVRLGSFFEHAEKFVAAFYAYKEGGEWRHADRLLESASYEAMLHGGGAPALGILEREADLAEVACDWPRYIDALLSMSFALRQTGALDRARNTLSRAESLACQHGDDTRMLRASELELVLGLKTEIRGERIIELMKIRDLHAANGNAFDVARIETELTVQYITAGDYANAERTARQSLEYFDRVGDSYGSRLARVNIAIAIGGQDGREAEASALALALERDLDSSNGSRERAVICNMLTRHYRQRRQYTVAADYAREAIAIGEVLSDYHLVAINLMNLGNVLRDQKQLGLALGQYRSAERAAISGRLREDEAAANELIASSLNEQGSYREALYHANYAFGLALKVGNPIIAGRAADEKAVALIGTEDLAAAIDAYSAGYEAVAAHAPGNWLLGGIVDEALYLCAQAKRVDLKMRFLKSAFFTSSAGSSTDDDDFFSVFFAALCEITRKLPLPSLTASVALSASDVFAEVPPVVARVALKKLIGRILAVDASRQRRLAAILGLLLAHGVGSLSLNDIVDLSGAVTSIDPHLSFNPHDDGAAHWTVQLKWGEGVVSTISQLDDGPHGALLATAITLLLHVHAGEIRSTMFPAECLPRSEVAINVISQSHFETISGSEYLAAADLSQGFVVSESSDIDRRDQPPIIVIYSDTFGGRWKPHEEPLSDYHDVLPLLLRSLSMHLLAKRLDTAVLFPKIRDAVGAMRFRRTAM
jgi:tetratricopeptide (TPR) repeat protein